MSGLIHYWPIVDDLFDYIAESDMTEGTLGAGESVGFVQDRLSNINGAIFTNPGYYALPPGIYFYTKFSFLTWIKVFEFTDWSRIIDCGNAQTDNILISLSYVDYEIPYAQIYENNAGQALVMPTTNLTAYKLTWFHMATVYDGTFLMMYVNGNIVANSTSNPPNAVERNECYIGHSNYGDPDASACFDDLMIFSRALTIDEVKTAMNYTIN